LDDNLPLVTIIAVCHNHKTYVEETLDSIRNQTYPNIQCIIINNLIDDGCQEVIENWLNKHQYDALFIQNETPLSITQNLNLGLKHAKGKYFQGVSCDDILLTEKTERQVKCFLDGDQNMAVVYSEAYLIKEDGTPHFGSFIQRHRQFSDAPTGNLFGELIKGNFIPAMTCLCKKQVILDIGGYDENLEYEDYDMWLRIAREYTFAFSNYVSAKYRLHSENLHKKLKNQSALDNLNILGKHLDKPEAIEKIKFLIWRQYKSGRLFEQATYSHAEEFVPYLKGSTSKWFIRNKIPFKYYALVIAFKKALTPGN